MKFFEVLKNLEDFELWNVRDYKLTKQEAEACMQALRIAKAVEEAKEGENVND